jgi:hypothetical protein
MWTTKFPDLTREEHQTIDVNVNGEEVLLTLLMDFRVPPTAIGRIGAGAIAPDIGTG